MTRGKQKIEAQRRNAEKNQKPKGSQMEARAAAFKFTCPICKALWDYKSYRYTDKWLSHQDKCVGYSGAKIIIFVLLVYSEVSRRRKYNHLLQNYVKVQLANQNQIGDHYSSKHPKEKPPQPSE